MGKECLLVPPLDRVPVNLKHTGLRSTQKASMLTDLDYSIIDFHVTLQRGVAALHQPFDHKLGICADSRLCASDERDADACREKGKVL